MALTIIGVSEQYTIDSIEQITTHQRSISFPGAPQPVCLFLSERKKKWRSQLPEDEEAEFLTK